VRKPLRRVAGEIGAVATGATPTHEHLRERLLGALLVTLIVDAIFSVAVYYAERHGPRTDIHSMGTAVFWVSAQLTTVSSQMTNPVTTAGRTLDIALEVYAITVVVAMAGSFGAFFHRRSAERAGDVKPAQASSD
jgi:hypothetical protein